MKSGITSTKFFQKDIDAIYKNNDIRYMILIENCKNLRADENDNLNITVIDKQTNSKKFFKTAKPENMQFQEELKKLIVKCVDLKYVEKESIVAFIFSEKVNPDYLSGVLVVKVSHVLYRIGRFKLTEFMENEIVLEKVLEIAEEIRAEGREGKNIGTLFIIGNLEELSSYLRPLVLNPFYGYPEDMRDLINSDLKETIKEYSQLDGSFIISNKGIVLSAGTYIDIDTTNVKKYLGWGTKHLAAVSITTKTKSIAVLVSESGGRVKVFKSGKLILKY